MSESASDKLSNLRTLQEAQDSENYIPVSVDEDGFYYIGDIIFTDFKSALRYLRK
jgi:hypothetical protein